MLLCAGMAEIVTLELGLWGVTFAINIALVSLLLYRGNYRAYPFFFFYAILTVLQNIAFLVSYQFTGFNSTASFKIAWGTQGLVTLARGLAVAEICRRVLAKYRGIWALGWRILLAMGILVLAYSWAVGQHSWHLIALTVDRGLELTIAAAILTLFLFIRYYEVALEPAARFLAIGFFLYSCFNVLNDTVLERWLMRYATLWNVLGTLAFLASLLLWSWALRCAQPEGTSGPELLSENHYRSLSPGINARLKNLNEQLGHFWYAEGRKT